ncbi:MAG: ABC transporter permease [Verrucomicrobia bacterium]|nr:ABC transporter permease [Verrucomicrobiota bacterium]
MRLYFLKRLLLMVPLLLIISLLAFVLVRVAPGGPFDKERAPASPEIERALNAKFHLDEPVWKQYLRYLGVGGEIKDEKFQFFQGGLIRGDFGPSLKYRNHTVNEIIAQGLPVSLALGGLAFCFAMGIGIPLGVYTAIRKGFWDEYAASFFALLTVCVPALVLGPLSMMIFAIKLKWLPVALWGSPLHTILPTITLGLFFAGRISRLMREGMLNTLQAPFITTARAKGLSEAAVLWRHAFPIAVLPVVSYSGPLLADLLTGSFVVETIFQIPGIGVLMVNSSLNKDYTLAVGLVVLYAILLLVLNLAVDIAYGWLDPRVRYE